MRSSRSPQDGPQVISRLQALFGPNSPSRSGSPAAGLHAGDAVVVHGSSGVDGHVEGESMSRAISAPPVSSGLLNEASSAVREIKEVKDRNALLVKVVTWNMGDALPKGDLSVLLGSVPDYSPLPVEDGFPVVPVEDLHPYHIVVVAGQECPTESGVPRGLGGGVIRGMKLGNHIRKEKKEREKEKEKDTAEHLEDAVPEAVRDVKSEEVVDQDREKVEKGNAQLTPALVDEAESSESTEISRTNSPAPGGASTGLGHAPSLHRHQQNAGSKGWSTMLDDWLCGPIKPMPSKEGSKDDKVFREVPGIDINITHEPDSMSTPITPVLGPNSPINGSPFLHADAPGMIRSASSPLNVPSRANASSHLGVAQPHHPLGHSPLARSPASFTSLASASDSSDSENDSGLSHVPSGVASAPMSVSPSLVTGSPRKRKPDRPALIIPTEGDRPEGTKCYLHLVKERLMGMYLSIYVHRDCRDLIGGMDKDFVTTGLAGGRLGNKGGIGISLKIADHRLLFVNSHLAAHTSRNSARLANIAKIKSGLQLDCFLPKNDPRNDLEDIADRFDTVFWCGDLNFRLDMSRLHAEWLVEQKKYDEALTWDQLKMAMKDPSISPFPGFDEGLINFPPTFKYDVWKSSRATNRDLRRSLKRRGSVKDSGPPDLSKTGASSLGHVPESGAEEMEDDMTGGRMSEDDGPRKSVEWRRSTRSVSRAPHIGDDRSDDMDDLHRRGNEAIMNGLANSHRPLDVKIKEKTKKVFNLVKLKTALTPSPSRKAFGRDKDRRESPRVSGPGGYGHPHPFSAVRNDTGTSAEPEFDATSRRTSLSSLASMREPDGRSPSSPSLSDHGAMVIPSRLDDTSAPTTPLAQSFPDPMLQFSPSDRLRRPTVTSQTSPPRAGRSFSLKRTMSGKSAKLSASLGSVLDGGEEDIREGVYDSSKKQRVPSWCDRVLWKAHPEPDPEPEPEPEPVHFDEDSAGPADEPGRSRPFGRLSAALQSLGGHLKPQISRTFSVPPESTGMSRVGSSTQLDRVRTAVSTTERAGSLTPTLVDSPVSSPALTPKMTGLVPLPLPGRRSRSPVPRPVGLGSRGSISTNSSPEKDDSRAARTRAHTYDSRSPKSPANTHRHPLLSIETSSHGHGAGTAISPINASHPDGSGAPARPRITFEPAASPAADRSSGPPATSHKFRARANSDCHDTSARAKLASSIGLGAPIGVKKSSAGSGMTPSPSFPPRRATDELLSNRASPDAPSDGFFASAPNTHRAQPVPLHAEGGQSMSRSSTQGTTAQPVLGHPEERGAFARFLRDIPNWLHRHTSIHSSDEPAALADAAEQESEPVPVKRHMKGEVVCLGYGTIDDAGMRALEGRSDHRPAIFSAAVYIDTE